MKKLKNNKGITLIALVITIIVLVILAGISIDLLIGKNGLFSKANEAKIATERAVAEEEVQIAILESYTDEGEFSINELNDNLRKIQNLTYNGKEIGEVENRIEKLPADVNVNGYDVHIDIQGITIGDNESSSGNEGIKGVLAKDVLKIDYEKNTSPYVIYPAGNGKRILCQVLYDANSKYGIQLIDVETEETVNLGKNDDKVSAEDFEYDGTEAISKDAQKSVASYNRAVQTLNEKAEEYINPKYTEGNKARCVGSNPDFTKKNNKNVMYSYKFDWEEEYFSCFNVVGKVQDEDTNYEEDIEQLTKINALVTGDNKDYWLASLKIDRRSSNYQNVVDFEVCDVNVKSNSVKSDRVFDLTSYRSEYSSESLNLWAHSPAYGLRPIIQLKPDVMLYPVNGDGQTPETAYEIELPDKKLASEVLKIDKNGKSPYVNYPKDNGEKLLCQVLYNADSDYGLQIMASGKLDQVILGSGEENNPEEFEYTGTGEIDTNFKKAAISYNNAIKTLNDKAEEYINLDYTEEHDARCFGSSPDFSQKYNESGMYSDETKEYLKTYSFDGRFKNQDDNYMTDYNQLQNVIKNGKLSEQYWLSSRYLVESTATEGLFFKIRTMNSASALSNESIFAIYYKTGKSISYNKPNGIRPVLKLKPEVYIQYGIGTKTCPYKLEIKEVQENAN